MKEKNPPIVYRSQLNMDTGETDVVEETAEERTVRLRRASATRRGLIQRAFRTATPAARDEAVAKALSLVDAGEAFPIHFDIRFEKDGVSRTERYSLTGASFSNDLFESGRLVGHRHAIKYKTGRSRQIAAAFVHHVRLS